MRRAAIFIASSFCLCPLVGQVCSFQQQRPGMPTWRRQARGALEWGARLTNPGLLHSPAAAAVGKHTSHSTPKRSLKP